MKRVQKIKKSRSTYAGIVAGIVLVGGAVYMYGHVGSDSNFHNTLNLSSVWRAIFGNGDASATDLASALGVQVSDGDAVMSVFDAGYENHAYGIRFRHPSALNISEMDEAGGYVILAEGGSWSFQIFILPWDEGDGVITPERIRRDLPSLPIENPQVVNLQGGKQGLIFESKSEGLATREVWIVDRGYLYQITAPLAFDAMLGAIMTTFEFVQ